jgi:hypothetical protein
MPCPYLREVVMLYCDAYPIKKMVPLDKLVTAGPCLAQEYKGCPFFQSADGSPVECPPEGCGGKPPVGKELVR